MPLFTDPRKFCEQRCSTARQTIALPQAEGQPVFRTTCRWLAAAVLAGAVMFLVLSAEAEEIARPEWKIGFWDWRQGDEHLAGLPATNTPVDLLYLLVGNVSVLPQAGQEPEGTSRLPADLPRAAMVFLVWRFDDIHPPPVEFAGNLGQRYASLKAKAEQQGLHVVGIQLDYDCPSGRLAEYSQFVQALRHNLPKDDRISVTALLDWFRPHTGIEQVLSQVDEFVPQFYDAKSNANGPGNQTDLVAEIAHPVDPAYWAMIFNRFQRPYRIGIASFGRMIGRPKPGMMKMGQPVSPRFLSNDLMELSAEAKLSRPNVSISPAGEEIVRYQVEGPRDRKGYLAPDWLASIDVIIPTKESIQRAHQAAQAMGPWCQGVVFFRWPLRDESSVLRPDEVLRAVRGADMFQEEARVEAEDGFCAAVHCVNLFLRPKNRFGKESVTYLIRSSVPLEYFLPEQTVPVKMMGASELLVTLPPYCGQTRISLGRAVTTEAAIYSLMEKKQ